MSVTVEGMPNWLVAIAAAQAMTVVVIGGRATLFVAGFGGIGWLVMAVAFVVAPLAMLAALISGARRLLTRGRLVPAMVLALAPFGLLAYLFGTFRLA